MGKCLEKYLCLKIKGSYNRKYKEKLKTYFLCNNRGDIGIIPLPLTGIPQEDQISYDTSITN